MRKFKSYKNWLNEKFTEDSDPIDDLNIGVNTRIKNYIKKEFHLDDEKEIKNYSFGPTFGYHAILANLASNNKMDIIPDLLVTRKANPSKSKSFALRWASAVGNVDMIKLFIEYGADPNDTEGANSLDCAIMYNRVKAVKYLMSIGARMTSYTLEHLHRLKVTQDEKDELRKNMIKNK